MPPATGFRLQFQVTDLFELVDELQTRGVAFEQQPKINPRDKSLVTAIFKSPYGIIFELLGENRYPELDIPSILEITKEDIGENAKDLMVSGDMSLA